MVHEALEKPGRADPRESRVVELRFFGGLDMAEIAHALRIPERTVERMWEHARVRLRREITR